MSSDILSWISRNKTTKRALTTATRVANKTVPIMKTIQAGYGILNVGETVHKVDEVSSKLNNFIPKASKVADRIEQFIPSMQIMGQSLCDSAKIFNHFNMIATSVGIGANVVLTYQGVQALQLIAAKLEDISNTLAAQTALTAQKEFPQYVYDMIRERLGQTSNDPVCDHWFFLYHPDNDWYPKFYHFLENKPLGPAFCGYTNQIDTVFIFMIAARRRIEEKKLQALKRGQAVRPVKLHLLIPAYQPILIVEALKIPEEIGDFVIEGRINSNKEFVWLNLPEDQRHYVVDIGQWVPPPLGWWDWAKSKFGGAEGSPCLKEPRVLGTRQQLLEDDVKEDKGNDAGDEGNEENKGAEGNDADDGTTHDNAQATPLHQRRRRHHKKSHRRNQSDR